MATANNTSPSSPQTSKPAARKRTTARASATTARNSTKAKATQAKAARTRSVNQTKAAVRQTETAARNTIEVVGDYAERAVLIPVGAALIARDRVVFERQRSDLELLQPIQSADPVAQVRATWQHSTQPARARGSQDPDPRRARVAPASQ